MTFLSQNIHIFFKDIILTSRSDLGINSINVYEFGGENYVNKRKQDQIAIRKAKKVKAQKILASRRAGKPENVLTAEKKLIKLSEYHLYLERTKLLELLNKENDLKYNALVLKENRMIVPESLEKLPDDEEEEKDRLMDLGFTNWTKNDFNAFLRGNEKYGRTSLENITRKVKTKTLEEVEAYSKRFWILIDELEESEKIKSMIEKGEEVIEQKKQYAELVSTFFHQITKFKSRN